MRIRYVLFVASLLLFVLVPPVRGNPIDGDFAIISLDFSAFAENDYRPGYTVLTSYFYDDDYVSGESYSLDFSCPPSTESAYCFVALVSSEGDYGGIAAYLSDDVHLIHISSVDVCSRSSSELGDNDLNPFSGLSELVKPQECPTISFMGRTIPFCSARDIASIAGSAFGLYLCIQLFI